MVRKLIDWWRKGFWISKINPEEKTEEWKYESTLPADLEVIADLLGKEFPMDLINKFWDFSHSGRIDFNTKGLKERDIRIAIKLESLVLESANGNSLWWQADYNEYKKVYKSKNLKYANELRELAREIRNRADNAFYHYTFCKYEDSILTVKNTLQEAIEDKEEIDSVLIDKAKEIVLRFVQAFQKRVNEKREVESLQLEAVSKSLVGRLDAELEFISKYIETQ